MWKTEPRRVPDESDLVGATVLSTNDVSYYVIETVSER